MSTTSYRVQIFLLN